MSITIQFIVDYYENINLMEKIITVHNNRETHARFPHGIFLISITQHLFKDF